MTTSELTGQSTASRIETGDAQNESTDYEKQGDGYAVNVGEVERIASVLGGGLLAACGLRRGTIQGIALAAVGGALVYRGATGHCSLYESLDIDTANKEGARPEEYFDRGVHVDYGTTINKSPEELYRFWRNFENLPRFMYYLESVNVIDDRKSHWVVKGPAGMNVEWDAEIINDEPNSLIAWRSLGGASVDNSGSVRFIPAPGDRGTEVRVVVDYIPPAGKFGAAVAKLFGRDAKGEIQEDVRRFKRLMETGEVPTTAGQPRGTCSGTGYRQKFKIA